MCCFSCCSCCFCCRFCGLLLFMALLLLLLLPVLLLLCCFVAAAAGAFRSPTVETPIFARFLTFQNVFCCLFCYLCCCVAAVCTTCCCLYNLLLLAAACAACCCCFFCFCLHCYAVSVVCLAFAAALGSLTVEKPTLAAFDLPKCQEQFYNLLAPH